MTVYLVFGYQNDGTGDVLLQGYNTERAASNYLKDAVVVGLYDGYFVQEVVIRGVQ